MERNNINPAVDEVAFFTSVSFLYSIWLGHPTDRDAIMDELYVQNIHW